jgi:hypothetical protein
MSSKNRRLPMRFTSDNLYGGRLLMSFKLFAEVKPQSKKTNIEKISEQEYRIAVQAVPVAGKAN